MRLALCCPPQKSEMDALNRLLSNVEYGPRDLYEQLDIPYLFEGLLYQTIANAGAREYAAQIAKAMPHVLFLIRLDDAPRFLYLLLDSTIIDQDGKPGALLHVKYQAIQKVYVPLAKEMRLAMLCRGFPDREFTHRFFAILTYAGFSADVQQSLFEETTPSAARCRRSS